MCGRGDNVKNKSFEFFFNFEKTRREKNKICSRGKNESCAEYTPEFKAIFKSSNIKDLGMPGAQRLIWNKTFVFREWKNLIIIPYDHYLTDYENILLGITCLGGGGGGILEI